MTRRDVAAMRLALEMLRLAYTGEYEVAHFHRVGAVDGAVDALRLANLHMLADALEGCGVSRHTMRTTVARAALYLRARLRAEAGDCAQVSDCPLCFGSTCAVEDANCMSDGGCCPCRGRLVHRRITPLWEQAAQWWATHERLAR